MFGVNRSLNGGQSESILKFESEDLDCTIGN